MHSSPTPKMDPKNGLFSPTSADYEALPPTVKRKYFSALERLRYAQGEVPQTQMNHQRPKTGGTPRYSFSRGPRFRRSTTRNIKEATPELPNRAVTDAEAAWYQGLPEKIKRNHFTFEERHQYAAVEDTAPVVDTTDELFYKLAGRQANRSMPSLSSNSSEEADDSTSEEVIDTPLDAPDPSFDHFAAFESITPVSSTFDDYHTHITGGANLHHRRKSVTEDSSTLGKKTFHTISSPRHSRPLDARKSNKDSKAVHKPLDVPQRDSTPGLSSAIESPSLLQGPSLYERRTSRKYVSTEEQLPPVPNVDPEAAHVSDPTTRLKLKLYLGSAAKFDEAVEFGFPATKEHATMLSPTAFRRSSTSSHRSSGRPQSGSTARPHRFSKAIGTTFFMDDDDDDEDDAATSVPADAASVSVALLPVQRLDSPEPADNIHTFFAELPAENSPLGAATPTFDQAYTASVTDLSSLAPRPLSRINRRSQSISLRPRPKFNANEDDFWVSGVQPPLSAREKPLKPWIEPTGDLGEREMTLRMTLTRKDLRADESLIYPDNGIGSWDVTDQDLPVRNGDNRWRFWPRRRS